MAHRQRVVQSVLDLLKYGVLALPLLAIGCRDDEIRLATVQGDITFNGLPALAEVLFEPKGAGQAKGVRPSTAYTDRNGHFELMYGSSRRGALVGRHRVTIKVFRTTETTQAAERSSDPEKIVYLVREIVPGTNRLRFALTY